MYQPGLASTEGDRPPTNPAIQVRFPSEADGYFFRAVAVKCATPIYSNHSLQRKAKAPSTGRKADFTFSL